MSFDAWIVGFGLSTLVRDLHLIEGGGRWLILIGVGLLDTWLLYRFFTVTLPKLKQSDPEMAAVLTDASPPVTRMAAERT
jgi:hypothetical protein